MHKREKVNSVESVLAHHHAVSGSHLIALVGSANAGKTTLFNLLTGSHYTTVNYPGATVEYALGSSLLPAGTICRIMDTPGISSLIPVSQDETVTVRALFEGSNQPTLVVVVVDANQISRHLYLAKQLQELGFPIVLAVTMADQLEKSGRILDSRKLSEWMECPVFALDPRRKENGKAFSAFLEDNLPPAYAPNQPYGEFVADMTEEKIRGYYAFLDEAERLTVSTGKDRVVGTIKNIGNGRNKNSHDFHALDRILLHPVFGLALFLGAMFAIFTAIFWLATPFMDFIDGAFGGLIDVAKTILPESWLTDLFADGLIGGIGAVAVFLPQIVILFLAMGYLEDSGYLARGAALVDKPLSFIGLNGRSFVPLLSGYACAIPAILAARTIPNRFERNLTIFIIPLMSCSARLPVYTLLIAFITPRDKPWLGGLALTGLYFMGLVLGALVSGLISRFRRHREVSSFILELPALRRPLFKLVLFSTLHKSKAYLSKAGLAIIAISIGLWILTHTPPSDPGMAATGSPAAGSLEGGEYVTVAGSYAGRLGRLIEPVMEPLGLDWRAGVAMMCGFAAREVFVSALALMYRIEDSDDEGVANRLLAVMSEVTIDGGSQRVFTFSSVLGMILFFMIALQCFPTVAVAKKEFGSWKYAGIQLAAFTGGAYLLTVLLVQSLRALGIP